MLAADPPIPLGSTGSVLSALDADGVLTLALNRPERSNAWTVEMERLLHAFLFWAAATVEVRVVVLTGAGRTFCPGFDSADLKESAAGARSMGEDRTRLTLPAAIPKPIVCAINGACAGVGLATALACDVRFAAEDARITTAFSKRGLPAEEGLSWSLPRTIGHAAALELLLSSRVVTGAEAAAMGMVHRALPVGELLAAAASYAGEMARTCSPLAMATIKRQLYDDWTRGLTESRNQARLLMHALRTREDFSEGVTSLIEKRPGRFAGYAEELDPAAFPIEP
jgi:enoyl-CoA hydratase/carnithine racemase